MLTWTFSDSSYQLATAEYAPFAPKSRPLARVERAAAALTRLEMGRITSPQGVATVVRSPARRSAWQRIHGRARPLLAHCA
jgi:hypothetical protein